MTVGSEVWTGCTRRITWRKDMKREWVLLRDLRVVVGRYNAVCMKVVAYKTASWRDFFM